MTTVVSGSSSSPSVDKPQGTTFVAVLAFAGLAEVAADQVQSAFFAGLAGDSSIPGGFTLDVYQK